MTPFWLHRPLINVQDIYHWAVEAGIKKMMSPDQLHITLCTVRSPVEWEGLELRDDTVEIEAGHKTVQIFGFTAKGLAFGSRVFKERHTELVEIFPGMDHPALFRPHVTLYRGGKMPPTPYEGKLVFGPEVASEFREEAVKNLKHHKINTNNYRFQVGLPLLG